MKLSAESTDYLKTLNASAGNHGFFVITGSAQNGRAYLKSEPPKLGKFFLRALARLFSLR